MENCEDNDTGKQLLTFALLINHFQYFLDSVFIVSSNAGFRLIVHNRGVFKHDQTYSTDKEAKDRFWQLFRFSDEEINRRMKPVWGEYKLYQELMNRTQSLYIKHILEEFCKWHA